MESHTPHSPDKESCLVIGGRGFLGRHLVKTLLEKDEYRVRIFDVSPTLSFSEDELEGPLPTALQEGRAEYICGNVTDLSAVQRACEHVSVVFHMASPSSDNSNPAVHQSVNVQGTHNVIVACRKTGVGRLVYTSSASVVFDGVHSIVDGDETLPYADPPMDAYSATKAEAEKAVLAANSSEGRGLRTIALRPSGIFGPGDPLLVPLTAKSAEKGKLKFVIGSGENLIDFTYVDNVVHAHLLADDKLTHARRSEEDEPSGKAFFITNGEPRKFWEFLTELIVALGYDPPSGRLPVQLILPLAHVNAFLTKALRLPWTSDFTPSRLRIVTTTRTFSSVRAAELLAYSPLVPLQEGLRRTVASFGHLRRKPVAKSQRVHLLLGGGQAADLLLWRNIRVTTAAFVSLATLHYLFLASNISWISLLANCVMVAAIVLFSYSHLQPLLLRAGLALPDVPDKWEIPEDTYVRGAHHARRVWQEEVVLRVTATWQRITVARDVKFSLMVLGVLYVAAKILGLFDTDTLMGFALVSAFAVPIIYETYEESIHSGIATARDAVAKNPMVRDASNAISSRLGRLRGSKSE
eukprot:TRINITY_DN5864_c0_g1_i1.p1 TRINITY_DN5864_c0_g1~~TRINITY_DN5864_c0_g1_i1.p1  ORF type:complete len:580 (+),score=82.47 TRINITY_DN5864_c0_g1_i1:77-1816(+)